MRQAQVMHAYFTKYNVPTKQWHPPNLQLRQIRNILRKALILVRYQQYQGG
jgi:hypothetical protein